MLKGKNKNALIIPLLAVLSGFIVGAVLMLVFGYNPIQNYVNLFAGAFGDVYSVSETLRNMTPLLLTGLGFAVSSKAGFFNIGGPGQYLRCSRFRTAFSCLARHRLDYRLHLVRRIVRRNLVRNCRRFESIFRDERSYFNNHAELHCFILCKPCH